MAAVDTGALVWAAVNTGALVWAAVDTVALVMAAVVKELPPRPEMAACISGYLPENKQF